MKLKIQNRALVEFLKKLNFHRLKQTFFLVSLFYFCFYFLDNFSQISFNLNFERNRYMILLSFLFCILSIFLNAFAWKNIVSWFGKINNKHNLVSFYVLTNILKYVPGGIWHFVERFNYVKNISNSKLAFYSTLVEPYFMLCASLALASLGIKFSPLYLLLVFPLVFLNRKLIYLVFRILESLKRKTSAALKITNTNLEREKRINLISFFPLKAFLFEVAFVLSKFIGFLICLKTLNTSFQVDIIFVFVIFCLSWSIGLVIPTAPSGVGVFEACFLFFVGKSIPQNIIFVTLIYYRLISTSADLLLSFPFLIRKLLKII